MKERKHSETGRGRVEIRFLPKSSANKTAVLDPLRVVSAMARTTWFLGIRSDMSVWGWGGVAPFKL